MRVLIIDNNIDRDSWGAADLRRAARDAGASTITVRRAPAEDLPTAARDFDRIVVSGSKTSALEEAPWVSKLDEFIRECLSGNVPILGVCYGHQALARVLAGRKVLRRAQAPEVGWTRVELTSSSPLTEGLPVEFHTFSSHYEEVSELPPGARHLARSERCAIQAFELEGKRAFGVQFHPERDAAGAESTFEQKRNAGEAKVLLRPGETSKLYDPTVCETIFRNFFKI